MINEVLDDLITKKGVSVVPLFANQKETHDKQWQLKRYTKEDFLKDSNVGVNLHLSGWIDLDLDTNVDVLALDSTGSLYAFNSELLF